MVFFTRFNPSKVRNDFIPVGKSKTQQQFAEQSDVNWILQHYQEIPQRSLDSVDGPRRPMFGDFSNVPDLRIAHAALTAAEASFMALPADLRLRFQNNPLELLAFVADSSNRDEAVKLGLIDKASPVPAVVPEADSVSQVNKDTVSSQS